MPTKTMIGLGVAALLAPMVAQAQGRQAAADEHWAAIARCAAIDQAEARHQCMDDVVRRAGLLSDDRLAQSARREFGNEDRAGPAVSSPAPATAPAPSPSPPPASVAAAPASTAPAPTRAQDIGELVTTVASAQLRGDRRLVVTTAEGSVWEQTQSESFRAMPRAGDRFSIERVSLGGFRCGFERSTVYRCRRVD